MTSFNFFVTGLSCYIKSESVLRYENFTAFAEKFTKTEARSCGGKGKTAQYVAVCWERTQEPCSDHRILRSLGEEQTPPTCEKSSIFHSRWHWRQKKSCLFAFHVRVKLFWEKPRELEPRFWYWTLGGWTQIGGQWHVWPTEWSVRDLQKDYARCRQVPLVLGKFLVSTSSLS